MGTSALGVPATPTDAPPPPPTPVPALGAAAACRWAEAAAAAAAAAAAVGVGVGGDRVAMALRSPLAELAECRCLALSSLARELPHT